MQQTAFGVDIAFLLRFHKCESIDTKFDSDSHNWGREYGGVDLVIHDTQKSSRLNGERLRSPRVSDIALAQIPAVNHTAGFDGGIISLSVAGETV